MKLRIKRWTHLSLAIALLAPAVHAAEIELTITPPNAGWLLPPELSPGPCSLFAGGFRLEDEDRKWIDQRLRELKVRS